MMTMKSIEDEFLELGLMTWEGDNAVEYGSNESSTETKRTKKIKRKNTTKKKRK